MLLDLENLVSKHRLNIKGVLHIGAHYGEEIDVYEKLKIKNLIFFEPVKSNFDELDKRCKGRANLYNCALGNKVGKDNIWIETANEGQSCSLLKPKLHLEQYPDIKFNGYEEIFINKLDNISFDRYKYNFINIDVQGYEMEVFLGSELTFEYIDYIYTEINIQELYEGCVRLNELDDFLGLRGFKRIELDLSGRTWGDAFYIRDTTIKILEASETIRLNINLKYFQPEINIKYPEDNEIIFENWFNDNDKFMDFGDYIYLSVYWTSYHVNNNYGNNKDAIKVLQEFINKLDRKKKYFTIVQYDDGCLVNFKDLDITIFSMTAANEKGGNVKIINIPLLSKPHNYKFNGKKDILCSFVGKFDTHKCRKIIKKELSNNKNFLIKEFTSLKEFCEITSRSIFVLCPRGYGKTSFRIAEALQYNAIPIYISDDFCFDKDFFGGNLMEMIHINEIYKLPDIINKLIKNNTHIIYSNTINRFYQNYYTYIGLSYNIQSYIKNLNHHEQENIYSNNNT